MDSHFLFRGVSVTMHELGQGLRPKGRDFTRTMCLDERGVCFDKGFTLDNSLENAVVAHQLDSDHYRTAGISTTPHFERAKHYATRGGQQDGVVYKITRCDLGKHGVQEYVVSASTEAPQCPEDDEVILIRDDHGPLPATIVIEEIHISA